MVASWWWNGELEDAQTATDYFVFLETFKKNAEEFAILRASISDGVSSWTAVQTSAEMLTRHTSSSFNVIKEVIASLDSGKVDSLRAVSGGKGTVPEVRIRIHDKDVAQIKFADGKKGPVSDFVALTMPYLELTGANAVDEEVALRTAKEGQAGTTTMLRREVGDRTKVNDEMASRLRLLMIAKRDRQHPS